MIVWGWLSRLVSKPRFPVLVLLLFDVNINNQKKTQAPSRQQTRNL
jgi:hypothetical protein